MAISPPLRLGIAVIVALFFFTQPLWARGASSPEQVAAIDQAESAERSLDFGRAVAAYQRALDADPESRLARRARARLGWLAERSANDFGPLRALERVRRSAHPTPDELAAFEHELDGFPPGVLRREGRALVTESWLFRLDHPSDAARAARAWLDEPNLDDADFIRASNDLALARARLGDLTGSLETLRARGLGKSAEASYLRLALLRRWARPLALFFIGAFVGFALGRRQPRRPSAAEIRAAWSWPRLAVAAFALGVPLLLARLHRPETWRTFVLWIPLALAILAVAALFGSGRRRAGLGLRALGVLAQFGAAYLALDHSGALLGWLVALGAGG